MIDRPASPVAWRLSLLGLCAILLAPLLLVDVPPLLDYPNHLARLFVLALGYSRKPLRLSVFRSSSRAWARLHEQAFPRLARTTGIVARGHLGIRHL